MTLLPRKKIRKSAYVSLLLFVVLIVASQLFPATYTKASNWLHRNQPGLYEVEAVRDGDTILVSKAGDSFTVRLIGVDTPELHHPEKPVQCFAQQASSFTHRVLDGQNVRLEADAIGDNKDRYGRFLRYVYREDGLFVNQEIIERGYGFSYRSFLHSKLDTFEQAETIARQQSKGLWSTCDVNQNQYGTYETTAENR